MMPHPRTPPQHAFRKLPAACPHSSRTFPLVTTPCRQVPPPSPHFAPPTQPLIYPQRNNDPRPNAVFPILHLPTNTPRPQPASSPHRTIGCLAAPSDLHSPCKRSPPSCPPPPDRSPPRNRKKNRYAIGHLDIYAAYRPQRGYRPLFSSVFRPAKEPEVLFFADYCYICQFQNWGVP